jgi:hypothetical protein
MSGEYLGTDRPTGVLADAYFLKGGEHSPEVLVRKIQELLETSPLRPNIVKAPRAPVWIPLDGKPYFVLTCPDCLRSFSLPTLDNGRYQGREHEEECQFCGNRITYVLNSGLATQMKKAAD